MSRGIFQAPSGTCTYGDSNVKAVVLTVVEKTSEYTLVPATDNIIQVDTSGGDVIINIPDTAKQYTVQNRTGSNNVILTPSSWDFRQHDGTYAATFDLYPGETVNFWADTTNNHWEF